MPSMIHLASSSAPLKGLVASVIGPCARRVLLVSSRQRRAPGEAADYVAHLLRAARVDVMPWAATSHGEFAATAKKVCEGVELVQRFGCDGIVAVGGGTIIDTAKVVASAATNPALVLAMKGGGSPQAFLEAMSGSTIASPSLPIFAVPTLFGAGSEASSTATILAEFESEFFELRSPLLAPHAALIDASLARSASLDVRRSSALTALSHCIAKAVRGGDGAEDALRGVECAARALGAGLRDEADDALVATAATCGAGGGASDAGTVAAVVHALRHEAPVPYAAATAAALLPLLRAELEASGSGDGERRATLTGRTEGYVRVAAALGGDAQGEGGAAGAILAAAEALCSDAAPYCTWDALGVTDEALSAAAVKAAKSSALLEVGLANEDAVRASLTLARS